MPHLIAGTVVFVLSFVFVLGAAPCWHFEHLWRQRKGGTPPNELLLRLGLSPYTRRRAAGKVLVLFGVATVGLVAFFADLSALAVAVGGGLVAGSVVGLGLHLLGPGSSRISSFFDRIDKAGLS